MHEAVDAAIAMDGTTQTEENKMGKGSRSRRRSIDQGGCLVLLVVGAALLGSAAAVLTAIVI